MEIAEEYICCVCGKPSVFVLYIETWGGPMLFNIPMQELYNDTIGYCDNHLPDRYKRKLKE